MSTKTILLVEDHASDIALTRRALQRSGIPNGVVVAEDGQDALDYLFGTGLHAGRDSNDRPALVLLDLKLPRVDGLQVLQRIRTDPRLRRIPVVILTSSAEETDIAACYDNGSNSYIRKPVDFQAFAEVLRQLGVYWLAINQPPPD